MFMFPGGWIANVWSAKWMMALCVGCCAVMTVLSAELADSFWLLILTQTAMGFCQGPLFPSLGHMIATWCPKSEIMVAGALKGVGCSLGSITAVFGASYIIYLDFPWQWAFYVMSLIAVLWVFVWVATATDEPSRFWGIRRSEVRLIGTLHAGVKPPIPYWLIATSVPVWASILCQFCTGWVFFAFVTWAPTYMREVRNLLLPDVAMVMAAGSALGLVLTMSVAILSDMLVARSVDINLVRKTVQLVAGCLSGLCFGLIRIVDQSNVYLPIGLLVAGFVLSLVTACGHGYNAMDIGPKFTGFLYGLYNSFCTVAGVLSVPATGWMLDQSNSSTMSPEELISEWNKIFEIWALVTVLASIVWCMLGRADVVFTGEDPAAASPAASSTQSDSKH
eukprot:gnl/Hemi2/22555_TR7524_c0_g1_i1.p1 gnl/Hemi2/22555_TR7524_c0_g1~~gnl/Hemi2/22555_TR7524_c0_g1_i1.p1  ORF type:complete len:392 (-),score=108.50 gnl/Hemi2/22555_TR7524_c0_g1_i1:104-1279(-)